MSQSRARKFDIEMDGCATSCGDWNDGLELMSVVENWMYVLIVAWEGKCSFAALGLAEYGGIFATRGILGCDWVF